ncbi:MAG: succinate dehydrogenase, cytochrome b556 subunit [Alphaproteobacteria bacterium]|nr:succinate dehydrogenase, cytochrome b556 subunit [Alphaproteobacteria bacterium]
MASRPRPLSPHLQVYRPQLTSVLSISHRITGVGLMVGTLMLTCWLVAAAGGGATYDAIRLFLSSVIGRLLLLGWSFCLFYHLLNGVRHLLWDAGWGFELKEAYATGWAVVVGSGVLTLAAWIAAYAAR